MGDILSLVEKPKQIYSEKEEKEINKIGNIKEISEMIPKNQINKNIKINENIFKNFKAIINSMKEKEKINPKIIDRKRKIKIAEGSGTSVQEINNLIQKFNMIKN